MGESDVTWGWVVTEWKLRQSWIFWWMDEPSNEKWKPDGSADEKSGHQTGHTQLQLPPVFNQHLKRSAADWSVRCLLPEPDSAVLRGFLHVLHFSRRWHEVIFNHHEMCFGNTDFIFWNSIHEQKRVHTYFGYFANPAGKNPSVPSSTRNNWDTTGSNFFKYRAEGFYWFVKMLIYLKSNKNKNTTLSEYQSSFRLFSSCLRDK